MNLRRHVPGRWFRQHKLCFSILVALKMQRKSYFGAALSFLS